MLAFTVRAMIAWPQVSRDCTIGKIVTLKKRAEPRVRQRIACPSHEFPQENWEVSRRAGPMVKPRLRAGITFPAIYGEDDCRGTSIP